MNFETLISGHIQNTIWFMALEFFFIGVIFSYTYIIARHFYIFYVTVPPVRMAGRAVERELSVETDIPLEDDEDTYTR